MHYKDCEPGKAYIGEFRGISYPFIGIRGNVSYQSISILNDGRTVRLSELDNIRPAVVLDSKIFGPGFDDADADKHTFEIGSYVSECVDEAPEGTYIMSEMSDHTNGPGAIVYRRYRNRWFMMLGSEDLVWVPCVGNLPPQNGPFFVINPRSVGMYEDVWPLGMVIDDFRFNGGGKYIKIDNRLWYSQREGREVSFDEVKGVFPDVDPESFEIRE